MRESNHLDASATILIRTSESSRREIKALAAIHGLSMNSFIVWCIDKAKSNLENKGV